MSDELDEELRAEAWRRWAPEITEEEIDALDALYDEHGKATGCGPAMMLRAYRLGRERERAARIVAGLPAQRRRWDRDDRMTHPSKLMEKR